VDLLLEFCDSPVELVTGILLEHADQVFVAVAPNIFLCLSVFETGNSITHFIIQCHLRHLLPSSAVNRVAERSAIRFLDSITLGQDALSDMIEVIDINGEPRYGLRTNFSDTFRHRFERIHCLDHILILEAAMEVNVKVYQSFVAVDSLWWPRLNARHVDIVLL